MNLKPPSRPQTPPAPISMVPSIISKFKILKSQKKTPRQTKETPKKTQSRVQYDPEKGFESGEHNPANIFYYTETRCSMLHMFESYIYQISVFITTT